MSQPMTLAGSSSTASYNTHSLLSVPSEAIDLRDNYESEGVQIKHFSKKNEPP